MDEIKVIQVGLGPIGQKVVSYALQRNELKIVGAADPAEDKCGRDLGEVCGFDKNLNITVQPNIASAISETKPDVAFLTTVSDFARAVPQAEEILEYGIHVVSTCEEMSYPWETEPALAKKLDQTARENGVCVFGTGINPGFLMDFLPTAMTGLCENVTKVKVSRLQDATFRRIPFQQKIGAALTLEEFEEKKKKGTLRHVGLTESVQMIASRMGWKLDKTEDIISPVIAEEVIASGYKNIEPGMAAGVQQIGNGYVDGKLVIELVFKASVGEKKPADTIEIEGCPNIKSTVPGGVNGDIGTCAITVNAVKSVMIASPGLRTMVDVPVVAFFK